MENMESIVKEVYLLRASILEAVTQSPLPFTIKAMISREITESLNKAEEREVRAKAYEKKQADELENKKE